MKKKSILLAFVFMAILLPTTHATKRFSEFAHHALTTAINAHDTFDRKVLQSIDTVQEKIYNSPTPVAHFAWNNLLPFARIYKTGKNPFHQLSP